MYGPDLNDLPMFGASISTTAGQSNCTTGALHRLRYSSEIPVHSPLICSMNAFPMPSFASLVHLYASLVPDNNLTLVIQSLESCSSSFHPTCNSASSVLSVRLSFLRHMHTISSMTTISNRCMDMTIHAPKLYKNYNSGRLWTAYSPNFVKFQKIADR